jgi:hypothetical protein
LRQPIEATDLRDERITITVIAVKPSFWLPKLPSTTSGVRSIATKPTKPTTKPRSVVQAASAYSADHHASVTGPTNSMPTLAVSSMIASTTRPTTSA